MRYTSHHHGEIINVTQLNNLPERSMDGRLNGNRNQFYFKRDGRTGFS